MFNDLPEEVARKWCQLREAEVPPTLHNPSDPSLASSFLLPLFPLAPLSVPRTLHLLTPLSPQSLSLSSFKERHLRNSKNIDFWPSRPPHPHLPSICVMAQGRLACCPYCDCWRSATLENPRDERTCSCTVNIRSWACCLSVNTDVFVRYTVHAQPHM